MTKSQGQRENKLFRITLFLWGQMRVRKIILRVGQVLSYLLMRLSLSSRPPASWDSISIAIVNKFTLDKWAFPCYILNMMNVILKTNKFSSRRTRNRIREHGPEFRAEKSGVAGGLGLRLAWLVRAEDGWLGWLPRDEFDFRRHAHSDRFNCE